MDRNHPTAINCSSRLAVIPQRGGGEAEHARGQRERLLILWVAGLTAHVRECLFRALTSLIAGLGMKAFRRCEAGNRQIAPGLPHTGFNARRHRRLSALRIQRHGIGSNRRPVGVSLNPQLLPSRLPEGDHIVNQPRSIALNERAALVGVFELAYVQLGLDFCP